MRYPIYRTLIVRRGRTVRAADLHAMTPPPPRGMNELDAMVEDGRLKVRYQYFRQLVPTKEVIA